MNNNKFVETYYNDIKNACSMYYKMVSGFIEYEDFLQQVLCIFLKRKSFDENYNVKPFTFICTVVKNEALQTIRINKLPKRFIPKDKLLSTDYINNDDGFNENTIAVAEIDESEFIMNDMIEKIKEKLSPLQSEIFYYLINDYKPREVSKILGMNGNSIRKNYGYIRDKARKTLEYYNLDIK